MIIINDEWSWVDGVGDASSFLSNDRKKHTTKPWNLKNKIDGLWIILLYLALVLNKYRKIINYWQIQKERHFKEHKKKKLRVCFFFAIPSWIRMLE